MQKNFKEKNFCSLIDNINVTYYRDFINSADCKRYYYLFEKYLKYNNKEASKIKLYGKEFYVPRKQVAFGDPGTYYNFSGIKVDAISWDNDEIISKVLKKIKDKVELFTGKKFNFVLINRYADGNDYIGFHKDDEKQLGDEPYIVGVSFGAERDFIFKADNFIPKNMPEKIELKLDDGSIIMMDHPTNDYWKHSIPKRANVKKPRISLTFRYMHN